MSQHSSKWTFYFVITFWLVLYILGLTHCPDSKLLYSAFSFVFLCLALSSFRKVISYGYLFLSIFLWLGFWAKYSLHLIFKYPYVESIGHFSLTQDSFDPIFIISIVGCLGILMTRYLLGLLYVKSKMKVEAPIATLFQNNNDQYKMNYAFFLVLAITVLTLFNIQYQIFQIGLVPQTILVWPFNALIIWLFNIGLILLIALTIGFRGKKNLMLMLLLILVEATLSSISILSRSLFILHVAPVIVVLLYNKQITKQLSKSSIIVLMSLTIILFLISLKVVSNARTVHYSIQKPQNSLVTMVLGLAVDRWLGIEGVMAVSSYPYKGVELLKQGILEKPIIGQQNMYQEIAQSQYRSINTKRFSFGTLPGAIAFLDYSNSLLIVFFGMMFLTMLMIFSEKLILMLTNNIFVSAVFGVNFAYNVEQFNTPIGLFKHFLVTILFFIGFYIVNYLRLNTLKNREVIV